MEATKPEKVNHEIEMLSLQILTNDFDTKCTHADIENDDPEELKNTIKKLQAEIKNMQKKQNYLIKHFEREKELLKTKTSRDLLDKLSISHKELLRSQENMYEEIITKNRENHESKLNAVCCYYEDIIADLKKKHESCKTLIQTNEHLVKDNEILQNAMLTNNKKLDNIQNLILGQPINTEVKVELKVPKVETCIDSRIPKEEHIDLTDTHETNKIRSLTQEIEKLNTLMIVKDTKLDTMIEQLKSLKEINVQYDREKNQLLADNIELTKSLDNMQVRHGKQFKEYEKLLKKSKHENEIHQREIMRLREHISSQNFQASPVITKQRQFLQVHHSNSSPNLSSIIKKQNEDTYTDNWSETQSTSELSEISTPAKEGDGCDSSKKTSDKKPRGRPRKLQTPKK